MSTIVLETEEVLDTSGTDQDSLAHYSWDIFPPIIALCGKPLRGVLLPDDTPVCNVCEALVEALNAVHGGGHA